MDSSKNFTLSDICQIAIQCLDRLEYVHSKGIIHCDIKPENFAIGLKDPNVIYLIDFGLCQDYKDLKTGKEIIVVNENKENKDNEDNIHNKDMLQEMH